jgi:hypothetical protein
MPPKIPDIIQPLLERYLALTGNRLPGLITGFYLTGSIALGGFNERFSDVDFVAVLNRRLADADIDALRLIHQSIAAEYPRWPLSGNYLQPEQLGGSPANCEPHPYYHDGVFHSQGYFELNPVTWWTLKNCGIALAGCAAHDLPFRVDWDALVSWMRRNLNTYWAGWTWQPARLFMLFSDWGIQWAVLGVLRQFYTFRENSIATKEEAGRYALAILPARWRRLIGEALAIREGEGHSAYRFRFARMVEAVSFLRFVIRECNREQESDFYKSLSDENNR